MEQATINSGVQRNKHQFFFFWGGGGGGESGDQNILIAKHKKTSF